MRIGAPVCKSPQPRYGAPVIGGAQARFLLWAGRAMK